MYPDEVGKGACSVANRTTERWTHEITSTLHALLTHLYYALLTLRITEEMVLGMGGRESDNYEKFLSFVGAAFVALRRHANARLLLSLIHLVVHLNLPDVSLKQSPADANMTFTKQ